MAPENKPARRSSRKSSKKAEAQRNGFTLLETGLMLLLAAVIGLAIGAAVISSQPAQSAQAPGSTVVEAPAQPEAQSQPLVARDLGPWAPNGNQGENFEVTCNETNCRVTHVQLWWPAGSNQPWGTKEVSVQVPAGLSIEVQNGAGKGWEYPLGFSLADIQSQIAADNGRRTTDTSFFGVVDIDDLIKTGLVIVRFDRRGQ